MRNLFGLCVLGVALVPLVSYAQNALTLSVTPTLFEMTANPAQVWKSSTRVINANPYDLNVYIDVVNFEPKGETGQVSFLPVNPDQTQGSTLAEWIKPEKREYTIPAEQTLEIPFQIEVPANAPPGGHYAAVLVGTKALETDAGRTQVETSQVVTSLLFLRVTGEVIESGQIRSFRTAHRLAERPEMDFELRFENKGNVHVIPQGEITIFNMWGQERGTIPVNRQKLFGNVLPEQIRKYTFHWSGEWSLSDIGRYTAEVTLAYGEESQQFASSETTFWVLPWKIVLVVLLVLFAFVSLVTWSIKLYIKKMLQMAGVEPGMSIGTDRAPTRRRRVVSVVAPIEEGMLDLRQQFAGDESWVEHLQTLLQFVRRYRVFFLVALAVLVFVVLLILYIRSASVDQRAYEVTIGDAADAVTMSSEQVEYEKRQAVIADTEPVALVDVPSIKIINQSGTFGLAADLRIKLEQKGYTVQDLETDTETVRDKTVIVYNPTYTDQVLTLSQQISGALLSAYDATTADAPITVYVGKNYESKVQ